MIAGTTFDARRSEVTSACWMVAGSWVLVGSKMAPLPLDTEHDKDVIMRDIGTARGGGKQPGERASYVRRPRVQPVKICFGGGTQYQYRLFPVVN